MAGIHIPRVLEAQSPELKELAKFFSGESALPFIDRGFSTAYSHGLSLGPDTVRGWQTQVQAGWEGAKDWGSFKLAAFLLPRESYYFWFGWLTFVFVETWCRVA